MEVYVQRRGMFQLLAGAAIGGGNALFASPSDGKDQASQNHVMHMIYKGQMKATDSSALPPSSFTPSLHNQLSSLQPSSPCHSYRDRTF
jgi:hypothetical protein